MELSFIADDHPFLQNSVKPRRSSVTLKFKMGNQSCSQVHIGIGLEICFGVIHLTLLYLSFGSMDLITKSVTLLHTSGLIE